CLITIYRGRRFIEQRINDSIGVHTHNQAVVDKIEEELGKRWEEIYIKLIGGINRNENDF
ncbi:hypothetical protein M9458_017288, partial [Cirrhinus mrigala]